MEKSLFWHQGLFLQPQHLQLKDLHDQSRFHPYHRYAFSYLHGVGTCEISESSLPNYSFRIERGEFWFEDMAYTVLSKNAVMEGRRFKYLWDDRGKPLTVYVGLRKHDPYGENVTTVRPGESLAGINTRYITMEDPDQVNDMHQGGAQASVKRLSYLLKVFFHTEIDRLEEYELIPVAQIYRENEDIVLCRQYVPPCVSIYGSPVLSGMLRELRDNLEFKGYELETHKKQRSINNAAFGSRDMVYLLALRSFNRYIPQISHMLEGHHVHPRDFYLVLRQLVGELSSFSDKVDVFGRNDSLRENEWRYEHNDLWDCFSSTIGLINHLIDEVSANPEYVIPMSYEEPYYTAKLGAENLDGQCKYYLVIQTVEDPDQVLESMNIGMKIASREGLDDLVNRSLPGVKYEYLPVPPPELPRRDDALYCLIDRAEANWEEIKEAGDFSVYWDDAPADLQLELMIIRRG